MASNSKNIVKYCSKCNKTGENVEGFARKLLEYHRGYVFCEDSTNMCKHCGSQLEDTNVTRDDYVTIAKASQGNRQLLEAMIELKQKDIIEYELKMGQFRTQVQQQKVATNQSREDSNKPKCPKCGSTAITAGQRGYSIWTGFLGSSATVNRCSNCGHKWKPGK